MCGTVQNHLSDFTHGDFPASTTTTMHNSQPTMNTLSSATNINGKAKGGGGVNRVSRDLIKERHNASEQRRREKINRTLEDLRKLLPDRNCSSTSAVLDSAIKHIQLLTAQNAQLARQNTELEEENKRTRMQMKETFSLANLPAHSQFNRMEEMSVLSHSHDLDFPPDTHSTEKLSKPSHLYQDRMVSAVNSTTPMSISLSPSTSSSTPTRTPTSPSPTPSTTSRPKRSVSTNVANLREEEESENEESENDDSKDGDYIE